MAHKFKCLGFYVNSISNEKNEISENQKEYIVALTKLSVIFNSPMSVPQVKIYDDELHKVLNDYQIVEGIKYILSSVEYKKFPTPAEIIRAYQMRIVPEKSFLDEQAYRQWKVFCQWTGGRRDLECPVDSWARETASLIGIWKQAMTKENIFEPNDFTRKEFVALYKTLVFNHPTGIASPVKLTKPTNKEIKNATVPPEILADELSKLSEKLKVE